jgi:hypothetical protein
LTTYQYIIRNTTKNIQSLPSNLCGFFCLAFIYFLHVSKFETNTYIYDAAMYIDLFKDLDVVNDVYKNNNILNHFFTEKESKELFFKIIKKQ